MEEVFMDINYRPCYYFFDLYNIKFENSFLVFYANSFLGLNRFKARKPILVRNGQVIGCQILSNGSFIDRMDYYRIHPYYQIHAQTYVFKIPLEASPISKKDKEQFVKEYLQMIVKYKIKPSSKGKPFIYRKDSGPFELNKGSRIIQKAVSEFNKKWGLQGLYDLSYDSSMK